MPFVEIIWKPAVLARPDLERVRDALPAVVGRALTEADPDHVVEPAMVDVRVSTAGPLDLLRCDFYVTVLARREPARDAAREAIVERVTGELRRAGIPDDTMVELILSTRASSYDYASRP